MGIGGIKVNIAYINEKALKTAISRWLARIEIDRLERKGRPCAPRAVDWVSLDDVRSVEWLRLDKIKSLPSAMYAPFVYVALSSST